MNLYRRNQNCIRSKMRSQYLDTELNQNKMFEDEVDLFLKQFRKRQDLFIVVLSQNNSYDQSDELKLQCQNLSNQLKIRLERLKKYKIEMTDIDKKILAYHFCTKIIEVLESNKLRLTKSDQKNCKTIQLNKHQILRVYKNQIQKYQYDIIEIADLIANFERRNQSGDFWFPKIPKSEETQGFKPVKRFLLSNQVYYHNQKQELNKMIEIKKKQSKRKSIIIAKNKMDLKNLRKLGKKLYKIMEIDDIFKQQFSQRLSREDNIEQMYKKLMENNKLIMEQRAHYEYEYKKYKLIDKAQSLHIFRIKKFSTDKQQKKTLFASQT